MKLSIFKNHLDKIEQIVFETENGETIPAHFHITEIGENTKTFIDCGGTLRREINVCFQLWIDHDYDHRLNPKKLKNIIRLAEKELQLNDTEIIVEYQEKTKSLYHLDFKNNVFILKSTLTDCLAKDKCEIPEPKIEKTLASSCCDPSSGCC